MGNKISKYSEKSRLASVKSWLHFLFPEILQPQYFTRAKRFVSKFLETAFEYFLCCRECRGFKCLRARGRRHVVLFCPRVWLSGSQLISVSLQNSPIVCVCDPWHWFCLTPRSQQTQIVITVDLKTLTPSNDPGSGNILITANSSLARTIKTNCLEFRAFYSFIYLVFMKRETKEYATHDIIINWDKLFHVRFNLSLLTEEHQTLLTFEIIRRNNPLWTFRVLLV